MPDPITILTTLGYALSKQAGTSPFADVLAQLFGGAAGNAFYGDLDKLRAEFLKVTRPQNNDELARAIAQSALHASLFCLMEALGESLDPSMGKLDEWKQAVRARVPQALVESWRQRGGFIAESDRTQLLKAKEYCEEALRRVDDSLASSSIPPNKMLVDVEDDYAERCSLMALKEIESIVGTLPLAVHETFRDKWFGYLCSSFIGEIKQDQPASRLLLHLSVARLEDSVARLARQSQFRHDTLRKQTEDNALELLHISQRLRKRMQRDVEMLDPASQSVPIVGRGEDVQFLLQWLSGGPGVAATALIGPAGSGKTRLAFDLLERVAAAPDQRDPSPEIDELQKKVSSQGWRGGLLTEAECERILSTHSHRLWNWSSPTLIVVDYPAFHTSALRLLLDHIANRSATPHPPLRILLIERHADMDSGWYHDLRGGLRQESYVRELFWPPTPRKISPLDTLEHRRAVLEAGLLTLRSIDPSQYPLELPSVGKEQWFDNSLMLPQWDNPLLLLMAAIIAPSSGLREALSLNRPDLVKHVARREINRLRESGGRSDAAIRDRDKLVHIYACAILCKGLAADQAPAIAEKELRELHTNYEHGGGDAVWDLSRYLGEPDGAIPPLAPDILAEAFLLQALGAKGVGAIKRLAPQFPKRVSERVLQTAQDFAIYDEPFAMDWAEALVEASSENQELLKALELALPDDTVSLRGLALRVTEAFLHHVRKQESEKDRFARGEIARAYHNLAARERNCDNLTAALEASTLAVSMRQQLANEEPGQFLPLLADSLHNHSTILSDLGMRKPALTAVRRSIKIYRLLNDVGEGLFLPDLGVCLNSLAMRQAEMGFSRAALQSAKESAKIRRELYRRRPDEYAWPFVVSLTNLSNRYSALKRHTEALLASQEGIAIAKKLAEDDPGSYLADFVSCLNNHSIHQCANTQFEDALDTLREAVRIGRDLYRRNPATFGKILVAPLLNFSTQLSYAGDVAGGLETAQEVVTLNRFLAHKDDEISLPNLAESLAFLGDRFYDNGQMKAAYEAASECLTILAPYFDKYPRVFGNLAVVTIADYVTRSKELGLDFDQALLERYGELDIQEEDENDAN